MFRLPSLAVLPIILFLVSAGVANAANASPHNIGKPVTAAEIAGWDIDVRGDGSGLPPGSGSVTQGEKLFSERCAACHGDFGEGRDRWPQIAGGRGSLRHDRPEKTPGSYWPYAPVLFDYIRRTMPFGAGMSLTADEAYALTAYVLNLNDLLPSDVTLDATKLRSIKMPNAAGFVRIDDQKPDVVGTLCMTNCKKEVKILSDQARALDVTPTQDLARQNKRTAALVAQTRGKPLPRPAATTKRPTKAVSITGNAARGEKSFAKCAICHTVDKGGANRLGPNLHGLFGRKAASRSGFSFSKALKDSGIVWDGSSLRAFLVNPRAKVTGTLMMFPGIKNAKEMDDLIAYLRQATGAK